MGLVAIVGRPNVGKSTLFNRIAGRRIAIVEDVPGVTRDRNYADVTMGEKRFTLVDTGGFDFDSGDDLTLMMVRQAEQAVNEADVIVFVTDVIEGMLPDDREIANLLRDRADDVIVCANKVDGPSKEPDAYEFYQLGFEKLFPISAEHKGGVPDFLDCLEDMVPSLAEDEVDEGITRIAVLGRPNVGKSSLVNKLLGSERLVVSDVAGTTRDAIDTKLKFGDREYLLIDTAGIRRRTKVEKGVERWSVLKAMKAIDRCHVCLMMLDATQELADQDTRLLNLMMKVGRGVVVCMNKWDMVEKETMTFDYMAKEIKARLGPLGHVPVISLSALTGQRVTKIFDEVDKVRANGERRVSTSEINDFLERAKRKLAPPVIAGKRARIYYMTQVATSPPVFAAFSSYPDGVPENYKRFLIGRLRATFDFEGVPIRLSFRKRTRAMENE